jgi:hypothetical protein
MGKAIQKSIRGRCLYEGWPDSDGQKTCEVCWRFGVMIRRVAVEDCRAFAPVDPDGDVQRIG